MLVAPSLISADFARLGAELENLQSLGADTLHLDVMDGVFVPNITFGQVLIRSLRGASDMRFDTHLMIQRPERHIDAFAQAGADILTIHYEATDEPAACLRQIRSRGIKAGISVKPATPVELLKPLLAELDLILIMTVEPGFGGQGLISECLAKITEAKRLSAGTGIIIEADGGATTENARLFAQAGCDMLVAGTAVFKAADRGEALRLLKCE